MSRVQRGTLKRAVLAAFACVVALAAAPAAANAAVASDGFRNWSANGSSGMWCNGPTAHGGVVSILAQTTYQTGSGEMSYFANETYNNCAYGPILHTGGFMRTADDAPSQCGTSGTSPRFYLVNLRVGWGLSDCWMGPGPNTGEHYLARSSNSGDQLYRYWQIGPFIWQVNWLNGEAYARQGGSIVGYNTAQHTAVTARFGDVYNWRVYQGPGASSPGLVQGNTFIAGASSCWNFPGLPITGSTLGHNAC